MPLAVFLVLLVPYALGLLAWLGIGLVPTLAAHVSSLHAFLETIVRGHGRWSTAAHRILDRNLPVDTGVITMGGPGQAVAGFGTVVVQYVFSVVNLTFGALLVMRLPREPVPRLLAFAMLGTAATFNAPSHEVFHVIGDVPVATALHFMFHVVSGVTYVWAVVLFPDGRLPRRLSTSRTAVRVAIGAVTTAVGIVCWRSSFIQHPPFFVVFFGILVPLCGIPAQTLRMRSAADPQQAQQCRLLRGALVPALATGIIWLAAWLAAQTNMSLAASAGVLEVRLEAVFPAVFTLVPATLLVGLLRYRLWDIDVLVTKTLVFGVLVGGVSLVYVVVVSLVGQVAGAGITSLVLAMSAASLAIDPARRRLRALANRVVFGQSLSPAEAMRSLAEGLDRLGPNEELYELARVVVVGSRASASEVWLIVDGMLRRAARFPDGPAPPPRRVAAGAGVSAWEEMLGAERCLPIAYKDEVLGLLSVATPAGVPLSREDERLLADLAGHAGLLVRNARLGAELALRLEQLAASTAELRLARERVVTSQDEERRQLERNLHDGAQQALVALLVGIRQLESGAAADFPPPDEKSAERLAELRAILASTGETLDVLCAGGLPGVLVTGGLGPALDAAAGALRSSRVAVTLDVELPPEGRLSEEIAAAVYFSCVEALQNIAKHARASAAEVRLRVRGAELELVVADDGAGFDIEEVSGRGGLEGLVSRLAVLGGAVTVGSRAGRGTTVRVRVPLLPTDAELAAVARDSLARDVNGAEARVVASR